MSVVGRPVLGVIVAMMVGAMLVSVWACSAARPMVNYERIDARKQEIAMLWAQIREWRQDAGLRGVEPPTREIIKMRKMSVASVTRVCHGEIDPRTPRCQDMCSLADAICENAESICRIARELEDDHWARDKCASSKASCKEAKQACCRCCSEEPAAMAPPPPTGDEGDEGGEDDSRAEDAAGADDDTDAAWGSDAAGDDPDVANEDGDLGDGKRAPPE